MEFQDRILRCVDCGAEFVWTAGEQQFFADKNFKNEPKRCKACKGKRASRPAGGRCAARAGGNRHHVLGLRQRRRRCPSSRRRGARSSARNASSPGNSPGLAASSSNAVDSHSRSARVTASREASPSHRLRRDRRRRCVKLHVCALHLERFHADRRNGRLVT